MGRGRRPTSAPGCRRRAAARSRAPRAGPSASQRGCVGGERAEQGAGDGDECVRQRIGVDGRVGVWSSSVRTLRSGSARRSAAVGRLEHGVDQRAEPGADGQVRHGDGWRGPGLPCPAPPTGNGATASVVRPVPAAPDPGAPSSGPSRRPAPGLVVRLPHLGLGHHTGVTAVDPGRQRAVRRPPPRQVSVRVNRAAPAPPAPPPPNGDAGRRSRTCSTARSAPARPRSAVGAAVSFGTAHDAGGVAPGPRRPNSSRCSGEEWASSSRHPPGHDLAAREVSATYSSRGSPHSASSSGAVLRPARAAAPPTSSARVPASSCRRGTSGSRGT